MCETIPSALSTAPTDFVRDVQTPADFAFRCIWKSWLKQGEGSGAPCIDIIIREGVDQGSRTRMSANTSEGTESEWKWHIYKMDQDGGSQKFLLNDLPPHLNMSEPAPNPKVHLEEGFHSCANVIGDTGDFEDFYAKCYEYVRTCENHQVHEFSIVPDNHLERHFPKFWTLTLRTLGTPHT